MKTITDIKKAMEPGTSWHTIRISHTGEILRDYGIRTVAYTNTCGAYFPNEDIEKHSYSHFPWPKITQVEFIDDLTFKANHGMLPSLIYKKVG